MSTPQFIFTEDWFSQNIPVWSQLLTHLKGIPARALEIGSYQGLSAVWLLQNVLTHPDSKITCIDTFEGSVEHTEEQKQSLYKIFAHNLSRFGNKVSVGKGRSCDILRTLPCEQAYDIIYIDGDHHAPSVLEDAVLAFPLLKSGGLMIFDDYAWPGDKPLDKPTVAIDAFVSIYADKLQVVHKAYQLIVKKL